VKTRQKFNCIPNGRSSTLDSAGATANISGKFAGVKHYARTSTHKYNKMSFKRKMLWAEENQNLNLPLCLNTRIEAPDNLEPRINEA